MGIGILQIYKKNQIRWFFDMTDRYNKLTGFNEDDFSIEVFQKKILVVFLMINFHINI